MEKAGLVARFDCPEDGRGTVCELTARGRALRAKMWPVYRKQIDALFGRHLAGREAEAIAETFDKMIDSLKGKAP
jgi:DNA-binding MarR family transcriptional regulator